MSEMEFVALRVRREFEGRLEHPARAVFPLLCPVREYDWVPGWGCRLLHSQGGLVEDGCVFATEGPGGGRGPALWVVTRHDPAALVVEFVIHAPGRLAERLRVSVTPEGPAACRLVWWREWTGLGPQGNQALVEEILPGSLPLHRRLHECLDHYLATGRRLDAAGA